MFMTKMNWPKVNIQNKVAEQGSEPLDLPQVGSRADAKKNIQKHENQSQKKVAEAVKTINNMIIAGNAFCICPNCGCKIKAIKLKKHLDVKVLKGNEHKKKIIRLKHTLSHEEP